MPIILAIETATQACSVGLLYKQQYYYSTQEGSNIHSKVLLGMVDDLLKAHNLSVNALDAIAVDRGPGSFTGLRIGIGVAQGLAFAAQCPMIGISSLAILANQVDEQVLTATNIIAAIDARMSEVYWCRYQYQDGQLLPLSEEQVTKPSLITLDYSKQWYAIGNAWSIYSEELQSKLSEIEVLEIVDVLPSAHSLLKLAELDFKEGRCTEAINFIPEYVRNDVAKKSSKNNDEKKH